MLNLRKLEKMAVFAFDNARRLHADSITLFKEKGYPSAYFLSVLAQEEIGKMHILNDFVWNSGVNGRYDIELEKKWLELLYKHPHKQHAFLRNSVLTRLSTVRDRKILGEVFRGSLEIKKQEAIYVGLRRYKGKISIKGKINDPFKIKPRQVQTQITKINDFFLVTGIRIRFGQCSLDNESVEHMFKSKPFIKDMFSNWKEMSAQAKSIIRAQQKFFKETVVPV